MNLHKGDTDDDDDDDDDDNNNNNNPRSEHPKNLHGKLSTGKSSGQRFLPIVACRRLLNILRRFGSRHPRPGDQNKKLRAALLRSVK